MVDYKHIFCDECGGVIGMYDKTFTCGKCGKEFLIYKLNFDRFEGNTETGWIFPVINIRG